MLHIFGTYQIALAPDLNSSNLSVASVRPIAVTEFNRPTRSWRRVHTAVPRV